MLLACYNVCLLTSSTVRYHITLLKLHAIVDTPHDFTAHYFDISDRLRGTLFTEIIAKEGKHSLKGCCYRKSDSVAKIFVTVSEPESVQLVDLLRDVLDVHRKKVERFYTEILLILRKT